MVLLCLVVGSRWLIEGAVPAAASTSVTQAAGCWLAAGCFWLLVTLRKGKLTDTLLRPSVIGSAGFILVLTGPAIVVATYPRHISSNNAVLAMALTPVAIAVAAAVSDEGGNTDLIASLWPGLAGLAGLLLLLPSPSTREPTLWLALGSMPVLSGVGAAMTRLRKGPARVDASPRRGGLLLAYLASGVVFAALAALKGREGTSWSITACGLDALTAFLTVLALSQLGAARWSAQFLLIPLLGLGEGLVFLHPVLDARSWVGLGILSVSAIRLLLIDEDESGAPPMMHLG